MNDFALKAAFCDGFSTVFYLFNYFSPLFRVNFVPQLSEMKSIETIFQ